MKLKHLLVPLLILVLSCGTKKTALTDITESTELNALSEELLERIKNSEETQSIEKRIAALDFNVLDTTLKSDAQKYAFWLNIYNAYIQLILKEHPEFYEDRGTFFSKEQIKIAGETVSFETIEHGILRKSQWDLGLGYIRKWFPGKFERKLRVAKRDYRVHFALNCGAKDCPPVAIYTPSKVNQQLKKGTQKYLAATTDYDKNANTANVTSLFSWFRGDFGGKKGTKKILKEHKLIPQKKVDLKYKNYDWTLALDNFIDL